MEQYSRLWEYCDEVKATNVGSTMKIRVEPPPHLQRLYVCLDACKKDFWLVADPSLEWMDVI
ncbi:unnamed protein product [Prunus armeniaca]